MQPEQRTKWAQSQAALVASLMQGKSAPEGFVRPDLSNAARSLLMKRFRLVQLAWPIFDQTLGESFLTLFASYAPSSNITLERQGRHDGWQFARWLLTRGQLPDRARLALLHAELSGIVRPRRGVAMQFAWLRERRRPALGIKLPFVNARILPSQ